MEESSGFPVASARDGAPERDDKPVASAAAADGARPTFVTMAAYGNAAQSRVFARSARATQPAARLVVLVLDVPPPVRLADLFDLVVPIGRLPVVGLADMRLRYSTDELCCALKPWIIGYILDSFAGSPVFYFDNDIELFTPLSEAEAAIANGANLVVTPQILRPGDDRTKERELLQAGPFNGGFVAVAPSPSARDFVSWWCDRARSLCPSGDQKCLELAPAICEGVTVLRHPGYNFAYWNAHERPLSRRDGAWTAAGSPLRFLHYHQWNLREQNWEQYLAQHIGRDYEPFAEIFSEYEKKVQTESPEVEESAPPVSAPLVMPSGERVPEIVRVAYARHCPLAEGDASEVLARAVAVLNAPAGGRAALAGLPITVLCDEIWQRHADLRRRFDVDAIEGRSAFLRWLVESGAAELEIPGVFIAPARFALDAERVRELEAGDSGNGALPSPAAPDALETPGVPADARERFQRQTRDIQLLVSSNKALRREVLTLQVRGWRDEEKIARLETELARTRDWLQAAIDRGRQLTGQIAWRRAASAPTMPISALRRPKPEPAGSRREVLGGDEPFFKRGFCLGEGAAIAGTAVRRLKGAPAGIVVFGPYASLPAGAYSVAIEARLYERFPLSSGFRAEVAYDGAQRVLGSREFPLFSLGRRRRFDLPFTVWEGENCADLEIRIWARRRTPLEIRRISIFEVTPDVGIATRE